MWARSPNGRYPVEEGHRLLFHKRAIGKRKFTFCWHDVVLPKEGAFSWSATQNKILTTERLRKLGICKRFQCVLCGKELEDTKNLLLNCEFCHECWK